MSLTADDVAETDFGNAPIGHRGYSKTEVDAFVHRISKTLAGEDDLTGTDVRHVQFGRPLLGRRGYDEYEVDEFLDAVEETLRARREPRWTRPGTAHSPRPSPTPRTPRPSPAPEAPRHVGGPQ